ncbi:MAG: hypothetical protein PHO74_00185 [Weeksellaceae bacterium]|nr:hypothetical protein [Weeksellaceae bacterium]
MFANQNQHNNFSRLNSANSQVRVVNHEWSKHTGIGFIAHRMGLGAHRWGWVNLGFGDCTD